MFRLNLLMVYVTIVIAQNFDPVPIEYATPILFKIIPYNRTLFQSDLSQITVGIFYDSENPESNEQRKSIELSINTVLKNKIRNKLTKAYFYDIAKNSIDNVFSSTKLNVGFAVHLDKSLSQTYSKLCKKNKVMSFSTNPNDIKRGVSLSCYLLEDGKPKIIANFKSLKQENVGLNPQILKLSHLIK